MTRSNSPSTSPLWRRVPHHAAALMICAAAWSASSGVLAGELEDREEAKRLYAEARKLRAAGDADAALDRFRRAHELAPTPVTRLELARELETRRRLVEAQALAAGVAALPVSPTETSKSKVARRDAQSFAASLEPRIATLRLVVEPASAEVEVVLDGAVIDLAKRSEPIRIDPGEHRVYARRDAQIIELPFALVEGESRSIELRLPEPVVEPSPALPPAPPPMVPTSPPASPRFVPAIETEPSEREGTDFGPLVPLSLTLGGLGLATGVVTGSIALSQTSALEERCPNQRCAPDEHALLATHQALTTTSTVSFVVGAALATAGVVLWALEDDAPASSVDGGARRRGAQGSLGLRWAGTGLALEGTWP